MIIARGQIFKIATSRFVVTEKPFIIFKFPVKILLMSTCMSLNKSKQLLNSRNTVSQQILAAVTYRVNKSTDHAKPHSICFLPQYQR